MKKKTKSQLNDLYTQQEIIVFYSSIIACFLMVIFGTLCFHSGFFGSLKKINTPSVAYVTSNIKMTRRCFEKGTNWDMVKRDSQIYNGDTIKTGNNSQIIIKFIDTDVELLLTENTMTKIVVGSNNNLEVKLLNGNILVDSMNNTNNTVVNYKNTKIALDGKAMITAQEVSPKENKAKKADKTSNSVEDKAQVENTESTKTSVKKSAKEDKDLEIHIVSGKANIKAEKQKKSEATEVKEGQMVTISSENADNKSAKNAENKTSQSDSTETSKEKKSKKVVVISEPEEIKNNKNVHQFEIKEQKPVKTTKVSSDSTIKKMDTLEQSAITVTPVVKKNPFTNISLSKIVQGFVDENDAKADKNSSVNKTTTAKPAVPAITDIKLISPAKNSVLNDQFFMNNSKIYFRWNAVKGATHYEFILIDPTGKVLVRQKVKDNSYGYSDLSKLSEGKFTWKVKALKLNSNGTFEDVSKQTKSVFEINLGQITGAATDEKTYYKRGN